MKLRVFQSGKGDCLLLSSDDGHHVLVDGGMPAAYSTHVSPALGAMAAAGEVLDLVYVSHIDQDHIGGVLRLFDDIVAWRVFDFQVANGNASFPAPARSRPPKIGRIWHNAFAEQIGRNAGAIGNLLAATAQALSGSSDDEWIETAIEHGELATSVNEAIRLSRRLNSDQLGIPLNSDFGGRLAFVRPKVQGAKVGSMRLTVIGPFAKDLRRLRTEWNDWLRRNQEAMAKIAADARRDADLLGASELDRVIFPFLQEAQGLGDRALVTAPNLASLMLLAEEGTHTVLLTGDGHATDIIAGLRAVGRLAPRRGLHVDVLKIQHHGSEHNLDEAFCRRVTADDYVFCGNGEHENPDVRVVRAVVQSRLGPDTVRSRNPEVAKPFRLWFNSASTETEKPAAIAHMQGLEALVADLATQSAGRMSGRFLRDASSVEVPIGG